MLRLALPFLVAAVLAGAGLWLEYGWNRNRFEEQLVEQVSARVTARVRAEQLRMASFQWSVAGLAQTRNTFLLVGDSLHLWSEHDFVPDFGKMSDSADVQFISSARSNFIALRRADSSGRHVVVVVNLQDKFQVSNRYVSTVLNPSFFPIREGLLVPADAAIGLAVPVAGVPMFRLAPLNTPAHPVMALWLFVAASLVFVVAVWRVIGTIQDGAPGLAFLFFTASLSLIRAGQLFFEFPRAWVNSPLFDPQVYAASYLNYSLGDLLINAAVVLVVTMYGYRIWLPRFLASGFSIAPGSAVQVGLFLLLCVTVLYPYLFFESIYRNSGLTIDITDSLRVDAARVVMWLSVVAGLFSGWLGALVLFRILLQKATALRSTVFALAVALALFLVYILIEKRNYPLPIAALLAMVVVAFWPARRHQFGGRWQALLALIFCGYAAGAVYFMGEERKDDFQQRFAANDLSSRDELGEYLLHEVSSKIASDPFIISVWNNPLRSRANINEKIKRVFLRNYFDQYDVSIRLIESSGENPDDLPGGYPSALDLQAEQAVPTGYPGVFIMQAPNLVSVRNYRVITRVGRGPTLAGYVVVDLKLKRVIPETVFPEVLLDEKRILQAQFGEYSYAWWEHGRILNQYGTFDFRQLYITGEQQRGWLSLYGHEHLFLEEDQGRVLVVSRPSYPVVFVLANFCFFLLLGAVMVGIVFLIRKRRTLLSWRNRTYAQRMQVATLLSAALPFLIMAITFFQLIRTTSREQLNAQFVMRARHLSEALEDEAPGRDQEEDLDRLRRLTDFDFSVFDREGRLLATNQPAVYDQQVLSRLLSPQVLADLRAQAPIVREEHIGALTFKTCYLPVMRSTETQAILAVPFFDFDRFNEQSEIRMLNYLLLLFVGVGLIAVLFSVRLTRQLVQPLAWLAQTLNQTTFRQSPSRLTWPRKDELGILVDAYNRMLTNWTDALEKIARQEKESAWREMAKQVAHEIKNPLTPMKLTLQQLQVLQARGELTERKVNEALTSLLHQIEILSEIATSFSAFAGLPQPNLERLDVRAVLDRVLALYRHPSGGTVEIVTGTTPLRVLADEKILSRAFSNVLLNAWQSAERPVHVVIRMEEQNGRVFIRFADNGAGIPEDQRAKIFSPSFTTKQSGSGLGLAISRQGIELCRGAIRFETVVGTGTTFEIELPAAEDVPTAL